MGNTQQTRQGYEYQDLIALGEILNFYETAITDNTNRNIQYVEIDSLDKSLNSLDDIVVKYTNGEKLLIQSKYAATRKRQFVNWRFLLEKSSNLGKSNIEKWKIAVCQLLDSKCQFKACLRSNRIIDPDFLELIEDNKVLWNRVPPQQKK